MLNLQRHLFYFLVTSGTFVGVMGIAALLFAVKTVSAQTADPVPHLVMAAEDQRAELKDVLPQNRLIGKSRLTVWGFEVYDARLWAPAGFKADNLTA